MIQLTCRRTLIVALFSFLTAAALFTLDSRQAAASQLEIDLSRPEVELTASFDGADLMLFGIHRPDSEVIIVVRGPDIETSVRRKEHIAGIWVNGDEVQFENAPSFYSVAATRAPFDILPPETLLKHRIGIENLGLRISANGSAQDVGEFTSGLIRNMHSSGLYTEGFVPVIRRGEQLFRTHLWFPSNVRVGQYTVDTYLVQNGKIADQTTTAITVHKVGIEADVYTFAHNHALLYGLLAIVVALVSGWTANAVFRKR